VRCNNAYDKGTAREVKTLFVQRTNNIPLISQQNFFRMVGDAAMRSAKASGRVFITPACVKSGVDTESPEPLILINNSGTHWSTGKPV
jgi:hypothetical protein